MVWLVAITDVDVWRNTHKTNERAHGSHGEQTPSSPCVLLHVWRFHCANQERCSPSPPQGGAVSGFFVEIWLHGFCESDLLLDFKYLMVKTIICNTDDCWVSWKKSDILGFPGHQKPIPGSLMSLNELILEKIHWFKMFADYWCSKIWRHQVAGGRCWSLSGIRLKSLYPKSPREQEKIRTDKKNDF